MIDCSTLTAHVLHDLVGLSNDAWADVVVADAQRPWSPIDRAVADRWGREESVRRDADGWYLVQGWRDLAPGRLKGHALLAYANGSTLAVLEATSRQAPDGRAFGVRWRSAEARAVAPLSIADAPRITVEDLLGDYAAGVRWARLSP